MNKQKVLMSILVGFVLVLGVTAPAGANLVLNGDMETDANTDGMPDNWTFNSWDTGHRTTGTWDTSTYHSATHSYKIQQHPSYATGSGMFYSDRFAVNANTEYTLKFWTRIEKTAGNAQIQVAYYNASNNYLNRSVTAYADTAGAWLEKTKVVTTIANTAFVELQFVAYQFDNGASNDAKFYIDDVSFTPEPATMTLLLLGLPLALRRRRK
ncbi:MAG: hypothetical protein K8S55_14940 [Phycisphaerae bacterium]|nr:hypothetical protein [Phycisphaerae bacterium]